MASNHNVDGALVGMCNPLLDISADVDKALLDKYEVKMNNAILAGEKHQPLYEEMVKKYKVQYIAGGAGQNSIRVAQWMLQTPHATSFIGCVGSDKYAEELRKAATADGVNVQYMVDEKTPTGTCACLIHEKERSLIANLAAANNYKMEHLLLNSVMDVWRKARFYYITGFFLTVSPASIMLLAQHSHVNHKTFCMNLSAPFISEFFSKPLLEALPYVDILFGNESEAAAFAKMQGWVTSSKTDDKTNPRKRLRDDQEEYALTSGEIALKIAQLPKNSNVPRTVVITQGSDSTVVVRNGVATEYAVPKMDPKEIVDANGAGDAFVGGFLSELVKGSEIERCVKAGHYSAREILKVSGTVLHGKPNFH